MRKTTKKTEGQVAMDKVVVEEVITPETTKKTTRKPKETALKPKNTAKNTVKEEPKKEAEPKKEVKPEEPVKAEEPVKEVKKTTTETKKEVVSTLAPPEMVQMFPEVLAVKFMDEKLILAKNKYKTASSLNKAMEEGKEIYFACYWTKRHLDQFDYAGQFDVPVPKSGFPNSLDLAQVVLVCEHVKGKFYALSNYTEAMYSFREADLVEENGIRFSNGMEFQVYVKEEKEA